MFFTAINQMMTEGVDLTIVIRKANGQMAVSTLPKSNGLKDEAQNHIVPLTVSGLPEELDAGFLQTVARPIQKVAGLITNMAQFEAKADKAAADSKAAKEEKAKETKEEKEKREKYEKHLKKAEELIAAGKHSEAVSALGQARLHAKPQDQMCIRDSSQLCILQFFLCRLRAVLAVCLRFPCRPCRFSSIGCGCPYASPFFPLSGFGALFRLLPPFFPFSGPHSFLSR